MSWIEFSTLKMQKFVVPATIRQIIAVYYRIGIWRNTDEEKVYCKWARRSMFIIFQFTFLPALAVGAFQSDDMDDSVLLIAVVLQCSILNVKMMYVLVKESEIREFITDIGEFTIQDLEEFERANGKLKTLMNFARLFVGMSVVAAFLLLSFPLISKQKMLPLSIGFPLQWHNKSDFGYIVAYVYLMLAIALNIVSSLLTVVIWYLMMNCSLQYRNLAAQFKGGGSVRSEAENKKNSETKRVNHFLVNLIASIRTHRNVYGYTLSLM